jgi:hypothetical protein
MEAEPTEVNKSPKACFFQIIIALVIIDSLCTVLSGIPRFIDNKYSVESKMLLKHPSTKIFCTVGTLFRSKLDNMGSERESRRDEMRRGASLCMMERLCCILHAINLFYVKFCEKARIDRPLEDSFVRMSIESNESHGRNDEGS